MIKDASEQSVQTGQPASWLADPDIMKIHNAFRLGWSLVELRSRAQIAALEDPKLPPLLTNAASSQRAAPDLMRLVRGANSGLLRTSQMRTIFNGIVALQEASFATFAGVSALYQPPSQEELVYLYPEMDEPDSVNYANIGISPLETNESDQAQFWASFPLYDVTRRALNCQILLLSDPLDNLVPQMITEQQRRLIEKIREVTQPAQAAAEDSASVRSQAGTDSLVTATLQACTRYKVEQQGDLYAADSASAANAHQEEVGHKEAIMALSVLNARLLQAWDGFLRERFSARGVDDQNVPTLLAYEAGRNLASISWTTSVNAVQWENSDESKENLHAKLCQAWLHTFTDSGVIQVLHQISALSAIFDDMYYRTHEKPKAFSTDNPLDDLLVRPDPALPSNVLKAVKQSIEYWQRTVLWLTAEEETAVTNARAMDKPEMDAADWRRLRQSLVEQSGIWFNLMTGQQDLRGFTVESVAQGIMDEAIAELRGLAQRDLPAAFQQAGQQIDDMTREVTRFVVDVGRTATEGAKKGINQIFDSVHPVLWVIVGISVVVVLGLGIYVVSTGQTDALIGALASLGTAVAGMFGIKRGNDTLEQSKNHVTEEIESQQEETTAAVTTKSSQLQSTIASARSGLSGTTSAAMGQAGSFLIDAYEKGLLRIQIELQSLNHSVAVAHPLVEFFVRTGDVDSDLDFLTKVIWSKGSREAQLRNVVTAAFGPISILLGKPAEDSAPGD